MKFFICFKLLNAKNYYSIELKKRQNWKDW
jgi:hypothetical protein